MKYYHQLCLLALFVATIIINGCSPGLIPFKGKYSNSPFEITSTKSGDATWVMITDLFAANGLVIKEIEKKKGLIVTTKTSFIPSYTFENKDGQLKEPQAWVVLQTILVNKKEWIPNEIYSEWSIQITEAGKGTRIKIDPIVVCTYRSNILKSVQARSQSTGNLEEHLKSLLINDMFP